MKNLTSEFKREERYVVIKIKDMDRVQQHRMKTFLRLNEIPTRECVVVEKHWPIYEKVWGLVENLWRQSK